MILNAVLELFHILGAVGWLGTAMLFGIVIGPTIAKLSPPARGELVIKLFPRFLPYAEGFAYLTMIMGVALAFGMAGGNLTVYAPTTPFGFYVSAGAATTIVAIAVVQAGVVPSAKKVLKLTRELAEKPGPPPAELIKTSARLKNSAMAGLVLLLVVLVLMVAAGNV